MKKIGIFALLLALLLCGCGGNVSHVERVRDPSHVYNQREIDLAMDVVERFFRKEFSGCTLYELSYDEEFSSRFADDEAARYGADEAIVLKSVFEVALKNGPITLEPGSTHYYTWTLTRNGGGSWTLRNWGYG